MLIFEKFWKIRNPDYSQIVENLHISHKFWKISIFVKIFEKSQF